MEPKSKPPNWNMKKFEANFAKEISHRKAASQVFSSTINFAGSEMCQQFLIIGIPPAGNKKSNPQILVAYPPFQIPNFPINNIIEQSFPTGVDRSNLKTTIKHALQDEFVFQLNTTEQKLYGVCVHINPRGGKNVFYTSKNTKKFNFCFCLLTQVPLFSSHFTFLSFLALFSIGKIPNPLDIKDTYNPILAPCGDLIPNLDLTSKIGHFAGIVVPEIFEKQLARYFVQTFTSPPILLAPNFELCWLPEQMLNKSVLLSSIDTLFSLLSVRDVVTIFSGLILDAQILVIGSYLQEVSMVIYALHSLLSPFNFAGTVFPILPNTMHTFDLLQLPTPFMFGMAPNPQLKKITFLESCFIVDLDKQRVSVSDFFPQIPKFDMIVGHITAILNDSLQRPVTDNPYCFPTCFTCYLNHKYKLEMQEVDSILMELQEPFQSIITDRLMQFFVTDAAENITIFNSELFMASADGESAKYFEALIDSQTFQDYVEERLTTFMQSKGELSSSERQRRPSFSGRTRKRSATRTKRMPFELPE